MDTITKTTKQTSINPTKLTIKNLKTPPMQTPQALTHVLTPDKTVHNSDKIDKIPTTIFKALSTVAGVAKKP